ncbi:a20-like zinc finger [Dictyocaulus viviparus]|uniref:A20-like zinc finger n=1 Tax=Dictyocaulus viviparus TaxID=29172 RepID=A0A0D8XIF2_DICVI|nr:a20-like zinc finger [Dictyocaulus viviparus]
MTIKFNVFIITYSILRVSAHSDPRYYVDGLKCANWCVHPSASCINLPAIRCPCLVRYARHSRYSRRREQNRKESVFICSLCATGCGYFGTPQCKNLCSQCWREHQVAEKRSQDYAKNKTLLSFDSFQERRKLSTESRALTIKKIFRSPSMLASTSGDQLSIGQVSPTDTPGRSRQPSPDSKAAREVLTEFLVTNLSEAVLEEVTRQVKYAVRKIHELRVTPDELSELIQSFYQYLYDKLNQNPYFAQKKCKVKAEDVLAEVEKYICISCYNSLFCASSDEEVADLSLQERIRSLNWVTAGFLETKLDFTRQAVRNLLDDAIAEMIDINIHRISSEKLECLVRCSHKIFEALKESGAPTSADEFLPVLIYVLLKGNPPLIQSNVKFISRFALPSRIMSGESGYFFTNLSCALQFVQDMNYASLKMDRSEFEAYTSGDLVPPLHEMNCGCNQALGSMEDSLVRVRELIGRQRALSIKIDEVKRRLSVEEGDLSEEFRKLLASYPSQEYQKLKEQLAQEEKETMDICSLTSFLSSSSRSSEEVDESTREQATTTTSATNE